jgi:hypothetical protein
MVKRKRKTKQTNNGPQNFIFDLCLYDVDLRHLIFRYTNSYNTKDLRSANPIEIEQAIVLSRGSVLVTSTQYMNILQINIGSRYIIFRNAYPSRGPGFTQGMLVGSHPFKFLYFVFFYFTPVSRRAVLCDWVWRAAGGGRREVGGIHTGFRIIILVLYIGSLPNLATWFPCEREITLFILGSLGQRPRSSLL